MVSLGAKIGFLSMIKRQWPGASGGYLSILRKDGRCRPSTATLRNSSSSRSGCRMRSLEGQKRWIKRECFEMIRADDGQSYESKRNARWARLVIIFVLLRFAKIKARFQTRKTTIQSLTPPPRDRGCPGQPRGIPRGQPAGRVTVT